MRGYKDVNLGGNKNSESNVGVDREVGLGELLDAGTTGDAAAGVAIPYNKIVLRVILPRPPTSKARLEPICRVVVHVDPTARSCVWVWNHGKAYGKTMRTAARLIVPVLVYRFLRSAQTVPPEQPKRHERTATTKAPFAFKVLGLDLLEGPFRRVWAFRE